MGKLTNAANGLTEGGGKMVSAVRNTINAWHGTPHDFPPTANNPLGEFDFSKIGTGEGAQAYGHGGYFAGNRGVSEQYRSDLTGLANKKVQLDGLEDRSGISIDGVFKPISDFDGAYTNTEYKTLSDFSKDGINNTVEAARDRFRSLPEGHKLRPIRERAAKRVEDLAREYSGKKIEAVSDHYMPDVGDSKGSLYNVNIDATPDELLDWDKPLSQQPESIQKAMLDIGIEDFSTGNPMTVAEMDAKGWRGEQLYEKAMYFSAKTDSAGRRATSPAAGSEALNKAGIKGIQYDDAMSRGAEGGTKNYVIFDDKLVDIAKKYGITLPAAAAMMQGEDAQAGVVSKTTGKLADLAMDTASRMKRAKAQGFDVDTPVYHGTNKDFDAFSVPNDGFTMSGRGVYLTDDMGKLDRFAKGEGANVIPAYVSGDIATINDVNKARDELGYIKGGHNKEMETINNSLKSKGFTGVNNGNETLMFDPSNIRSVNAAFDPAKKESSNLLASAAPATVGLGALAGGEDAEAGPLMAGGKRLIDARFSSPLGGGNPRKGVIPTMEGMETGITPRAMDMGGEHNLFDFEGSPYILTQSDRSAAGGVIDTVHGTPINPVDLRGGRDFMFDPKSEGQVWASDPNVVKSLQKRAQALEGEYGEAPLLLPYSMAPTGIDFATMPLDTMVNYAREKMSKANIKKLDKKIKTVIPEWKGVSDPSANSIFRDVKGPKRKAVADIIDKDFRDVRGGLSISEGRAATTATDQYMVPEGNIKNIGRIDTQSPLISDSGHPTYMGGLAGEGVGTFGNEINVRPFMAQQGRQLSGGPSDIRALSMNHGLSQGVITDDLLRSIYGAADPRLLTGIASAGALGTIGAREYNQSQAEQIASLHAVEADDDAYWLQKEYDKLPLLDQAASAMNSATTPVSNLINPNLAMSAGGATNPALWMYGAMNSESPITGVTDYMTRFGGKRPALDRMKEVYTGVLDLF